MQQPANYGDIPLESLQKQLKTDIKRGLSQVEAAERLKVPTTQLKTSKTKGTETPPKSKVDSILPKIVAVKRDNNYVLIKMDEIVIGDVIFLKEGDKLPAEVRIIEATQDFTLSKIVASNSPLPGKELKTDSKTSQQYFQGGEITAGKAMAVVCVLFPKAKSRSGSDAVLRTSHPDTQLLSKLQARHIFVNNPQKLSSLAKITCIITGMRGVLTQNKLTISCLAYDAERTVIGEKSINYDETKPGTLQTLLMAMTYLCHGPSYDFIHINDLYQSSDITAKSHFVRLLGKLPPSLTTQIVNFEELKTPKIQFSICKKKSGTTVVVIRGELDTVIALCSTILFKGEIDKLDEKRNKQLITTNQSILAEAEEVIAIAYKEVTTEVTTSSVLSMKEFCFLGQAAVYDPLRELASESLVQLEEMGIRIILTSYDTPKYAKKIAQRVGYLDNVYTVEDLASTRGVTVDQIPKGDAKALVTESNVLLSEIHGNELDDALLKKKLVFASVTPKQKAYLVEALKMRGDIVAVTAETWNDILCLTKADASFCLNYYNSDICKEVADLVVLDDSFPNVVYAMVEAREDLTAVASASGSRPDQSKDHTSCLIS